MLLLSWLCGLDNNNKNNNTYQLNNVVIKVVAQTGIDEQSEL